MGIIHTMAQPAASPQQLFFQQQLALHGQILRSPAHKVILPAYACDHAARQQWHGGRSKAKGTQAEGQYLYARIADKAEQQLLGLAEFSVTSQLVASVAHSTRSGALLLPQLATHNSGPNSGNLRKQPKKEACHAEGKPALKVTFSGFPRYRPKDLSDLLTQEAPQPDAAAAAAALPEGLQYIRVQGTCTVALAPDAAGCSQEVPLSIVRYFPFRKQLPPDILALLQPSLDELQEAQRAADAAAAAGRSGAKKAHKWSSPPLWWIPFELLFKEAAAGGSAQQGAEGAAAAAAQAPGHLGWVGGICLYEFPDPGTHQGTLPAATQQGALQQHQLQQQAMLWHHPQQQQQHLHQQQMAGLTDPACGLHGGLAPPPPAATDPAGLAAAAAGGAWLPPAGLACTPEEERGMFDGLLDSPAAPAWLNGSTSSPLQHHSDPIAAQLGVPDPPPAPMEVLGAHQGRQQQQQQQQQPFSMPSVHSQVGMLDLHGSSMHPPLHQQHQHHQHYQQQQQQQPGGSHAGAQLPVDALLLPQIASLQLSSSTRQRLNAARVLLEWWLLRVAAGYCGDSSTALFQLLLQQVERHNSAVVAAVGEGLLDGSRYLIDVLTVTGAFGRTLLHLLASDFPGPVLLPEGFDYHQRDDPGALAHYVAATASLATQVEVSTADVQATTARATAAAAAAAAGVGSCSSDGAGLPLVDVLLAAAHAEATSASSSGGRCSLSPQQRLQLLGALRELAQQQGRWRAVLGACSREKPVPAWLTSCHWCIPEALDFFLQDASFSLQDMMFVTNGGRCFYHIIVRQVRELQGDKQMQARCTAALTRTLSALADKLTAALMCVAAGPVLHSAAAPAAPSSTQQTNKRPRLDEGGTADHGQQQHLEREASLSNSHGAGSCADVAAAAAAAGANRGGAGEDAAAGGDSGVPRWPAQVLQVLQQQYIYHLPGAPEADRALLSSTVLQLFGFHVQDQPSA